MNRPSFVQDRHNPQASKVRLRIETPDTWEGVVQSDADQDVKKTDAAWGKLTYLCEPSTGLEVCFRPPSEAFMLEEDLFVGLAAPLGCAVREMPEPGFALEAVPEAI